MRGNYVPRVGPKGDRFYLNWSYWDADLKSSPVYEERANLNVETMYFLSAYKNLFSGVATVNDHFPHEINDPFIPRLPIRVIKEYTLAHECSSYDLKWGKGIEIEHKMAQEKDWPFITHLEEGFDPESQDGISILERLGCLDNRDLFIHCIGFSDEDVAKTAKAGASVSWCPASNMFMFNVTCKIRKLLKAGVNVAIGTDSTHTGSINLMAEVKFARETYRRLYGEDLPAETLFRMVTINPARAFRMQDRVGTLDEGKKADILVLRARHDDPYENLARADMDDVEFLSVDGEPVYADERFAELMPEGPHETVTVGGRAMSVKGTPLSLYRAVREAVGFKKKLGYLPFEC
ncbi:MAG: amidohydrolase family protein [Spirochaetales bacterium]|nr:amidohydrolase family protein [Spirochaetales bacterium]MBP7263924.1 amidohydrolase family protein [Spirochaetia bacterium]